MSENETFAPIEDQNSGQFLRETRERSLEPYTLWFGDVITFGKEADPNVNSSVIIDVKKAEDPNFTVAHVSKREDGSDMLLVGAISTHGVEQPFSVLGKWTVEQVKAAVKNNFDYERTIANKSELSPADKEKRMKLLDLMEKRELTRMETLAENKSRAVTPEEILAGKSIAKTI